MNRSWQCAAIRRMLFGPVTGAFPASLIRRHANVSLDVVAEVLALPEPGLR
jgi:glucosamine-6-phosphate deaminase